MAGVLIRKKFRYRYAQRENHVNTQVGVLCKLRSDTSGESKLPDCDSGLPASRA